jgi:hypothetical protein
MLTRLMRGWSASGLILPVRSGNNEQQCRLDDVDTGDDEGDDQEERLADEPAGRGGESRDGKEREPNAADHRGHIAIRRVAAAHGGQCPAEEHQRDDR